VTAEPRISVVVPYYERQDQLDRLLAGLDAQDLPADAFELVVADDGSRVAPTVGRHDFRVAVVRQDDAGFRLAAARNLGAAAATAPVLAFLDQDCIPSPSYLAELVRAATSPWALVLGHRRHAELDGWSAAMVGHWLQGGGPGPRELTEPQWLLDGYARTADLTEPDPRAYQLVIGAAITLHAELFARLGGFDESFRSYGGEDWELGHRALVAGADTRWLRDAVVWHDGPDLAGRGADLVTTKNAETLALASRIPDRDLRGENLVWTVPDIVVRLRSSGASAAVLLASIESLLAGSDAHVWIDDVEAAAAVLSVVNDARIHAGRPPTAILDRARYRVAADPVLLSGTTLRKLSAEAPTATDGLRISAARDLNRTARGLPSPASRPWPTAAAVERLRDEPLLERLWQGRAV
jgi:GT2 family glycosyltransferase